MQSEERKRYRKIEMENRTSFDFVWKIERGANTSVEGKKRTFLKEKETFSFFFPISIPFLLQKKPITSKKLLEYSLWL